MLIELLIEFLDQVIDFKGFFITFNSHVKVPCSPPNNRPGQQCPGCILLEPFLRSDQPVLFRFGFEKMPLVQINGLLGELNCS